MTEILANIGGDEISASVNSGVPIAVDMSGQDISVEIGSGSTLNCEMTQGSPINVDFTGIVPHIHDDLEAKIIAFSVAL